MITDDKLCEKWIRMMKVIVRSFIIHLLCVLTRATPPRPSWPETYKVCSLFHYSKYASFFFFSLCLFFLVIYVDKWTSLLVELTEMSHMARDQDRLRLFCASRQSLHNFRIYAAWSIHTQRVIWPNCKDAQAGLKHHFMYTSVGPFLHIEIKYCDWAYNGTPIYTSSKETAFQYYEFHPTKAARFASERVQIRSVNMVNINKV